MYHDIFCVVNISGGVGGVNVGGGVQAESVEGTGGLWVDVD